MQRSWTPDEITLTIEAWVAIHERGRGRADVISDLALALAISAAEASAAIDAVAARTGLSRVALALRTTYLDDGRHGRLQLEQAAAAIRRLWLGKARILAN